MKAAETSNAMSWGLIDPWMTWRRGLLLISTVLATYQLYFLPAAGTFFPLSLLTSLMCLAFIRFREEDAFLIKLVLAYVATVFISGLWSSDKGAWATAIIYGFLAFIGFFTARSFTDPMVLKKVLVWFLIFASINAILVIIFRLSPALEDIYLGSSLRGVFKNPKLLAEIELNKPNVYDIDKAGGIFDNANTGAGFSLLCFGISIALREYCGRVLATYFLAMFSLAVFCSGSKSAVIIFAIAFSLMMLRPVANIKNPHWKVVIISITPLLIVSGIALATFMFDTAQSSDFGQDLEKTSNERRMLWRIAVATFSRHPLRGLGFGGWAETLGAYAATGVNVSLPPHNSLIMAWSDSGFLAAALVFFIWSVFACQLIFTWRCSVNRNESMGALFSLVCVAAMSMGDTVPLFGNATTSFPLGVLLALGISGRDAKA